MRIASWLFVICAVLAAIGLFLPALEARGGRLARRATLSLRQAASDRALARRVLAVYRASHGQHVGMELVGALEPHAGGRVKDALDDAHDAMDTLGGISDDDAKTLGTALAATVWGFLALQVIMAELVFFQSVTGQYRRGRLIAALVLAIVGAAIGGALFFGANQVVFEINDEVSLDIVKLGAGAYLILTAVIGALVLAVALVVMDARTRRDARAA